MVIVLIRRFVRIGREKEFLDTYLAQRPTQNPAFKGETLTRVGDEAALPAGLRGLSLGEPGCVTYLNVARWASWQAFADAFDAGVAFDPEIETAPRQRTVLDVVLDTPPA